MKIEIGDLVRSNEYIDPNVYLFGMVVGFHGEFINDECTYPPFKIEWLHKEAGWTYHGDLWYDDELELVDD